MRPEERAIVEAALALVELDRGLSTRQEWDDFVLAVDEFVASAITERLAATEGDTAE